MRPRGRPRSFDRDQALERAISVFLARGYDGATLEELLEAMGGIGPPSFYAAFGSKENLFRQAVDAYRARTGNRGQRALAAPRVRDAVLGMLRESVDGFCGSGEARGCLIILGATNCTRANQDAYEHLRSIRQQLPRLLRKRLERAVAEGELRAGLDLAGIASFYATVLQGLALRARDGASRPALRAAVDGAMAAWEALTAGAGPTPRPPRARRRAHPPR